MVAKRFETHATEVKGAVDEIAADDIALVEQNLGTDVAGDFAAGMNGNERVVGGKRHGERLAVFQMNDVDDTVGMHFVAGGVDHVVRKIGTRKMADGIDTACEGEIADEHDGALVEVGIDVVNKFVVADAEDGAGFAGVGAEPDGLTANRGRLAPDAQM